MVPEQRRGLLVVGLGVAAVDLGRGLGHRRVEVHGHLRDPALVEQPAQRPHDLLGAPDRERRDQQRALPADGVVDDLGQRRRGLLRRFVLAAAVRGLAEDDVALGHGRGVADDRRPRPAEIARKHHDRVAPTARPREAHADNRRAQDVPRVRERDVHALRDLALLPVGHGLEHRQRQVDVVLRVQRIAEVEHHLRPGRTEQLLGIGAAGALGALGRQLEHLRVVLLGSGRVVLGAFGVAALASGRPLGELHLELGRVEQHEPGELGGRRGAHDRAPEALVDEQRQQAAVVEVGVGEDDGVERRRVDAQRHPVAHRLVGAALEHAAVDEDAGPTRVDEVARAGDRARSAEEGQLHAPIVTHRAAPGTRVARCGHVRPPSPRRPRGCLPRRARCS